MDDHDSQIQAALAKLAQKKADLAAMKKEQSAMWATTGMFKMVGATAPVNIQTMSEQGLLDVAINIELLSAATATAQQKLGVDVEQTIQGYSVDKWYADLKKRLASIQIRQTEAAIAQLDARLSGLLSAEARRSAELAAVLSEVETFTAGS